MTTARRRLAALLLAVGAAGCAQPGQVPVAERSPVLERSGGSYRVTGGDTVYSIAWRFGLDYRALARANGIEAPYTIYAGQRLRLAERAPGRQRDRTAAGSPSAAASHPAADVPWHPPTRSPVSRGYGGGNQGIDYRLGSDHRVNAAAAGQVVYAGSGLGGFRHLVIVKHDAAYLSAYSLDRPMAVREGQQIKAGQLLADKQAGGRRSETLHFEIRRHGEPVDPSTLMSR